ncbi:hypothetical protein PCANC_07920 [Puccinia coronata f. sp. avenae]|uniref:MADS-box domain-containing protein n=1 Tax=Puccinia coronata f. sp. avenae TaxID=200324 RepID=A0A2N5UY80_9BASI|nr:hypothetical protein PCANC_07920 [Puccinia coronata f. sp. avenae]
MDSVSCHNELGATRSTRPLPSTTGSSAVERDPPAPTGSPDLGGTLVSNPPDGVAELSSGSEDEDATGSGSKRRKGQSKYSVPRRQIKIEYIQDKSRRNITFGKRKNGIFKKAQEISILTGCEVMLIVAPKDSEPQAFTYATTKLKPLISEPAGEAYIQNCLRYGALMPGTSSGASANYGMNRTNGQHSNMATIRTGPRASPAPNVNAISYNSSYYVHNGGDMSRRAHPPYGISQPHSVSPQSTSTNVTNKQTPQSVGFSDQTKRAASDSPVQHLGVSHHPYKSQPWSPGPNASTNELPASPAVTAPNSAMAPSREIPADWIVANPRSLFQTSSPLGASSLSTRGLSSFPLSTATPGSGNGYSHLPSDSNTFHSRPASDGPVIATPTWPPVSQTSPGIRSAPLDSARNGNSSNAPINDARFLEPLVLSQPYDPRALGSGEEQYGSSSNYPSNSAPSLNMQPSVSPYGESENCDGVGLSSTYLHEDNSGGETDSKHYLLENSDHNWSGGL